MNKYTDASGYAVTPTAKADRKLTELEDIHLGYDTELEDRPSRPITSREARLKRATGIEPSEPITPLTESLQ